MSPLESSIGRLIHRSTALCCRLDAPAGAAGFKNWASLGCRAPSAQAETDETPAPGGNRSKSGDEAQAASCGQDCPARQRD
jgi:hypothetical protein